MMSWVDEDVSGATSSIEQSLAENNIEAWQFLIGHDYYPSTFIALREAFLEMSTGMWYASFTLCHLTCCLGYNSNTRKKLSHRLENTHFVSSRCYSQEVGFLGRPEQ